MLQMIIATMMGLVLGSMVMVGLMFVLLSCKPVMRLYVRYVRRVSEMMLEESLNEA